MIKISLQFGKVLPLEMKIQVRKVAGGAEISYMDNGAGSWRCGRIYAPRKPEEPLPRKKDGAYRLHNVIDLK